MSYGVLKENRGVRVRPHLEFTQGGVGHTSVVKAQKESRLASWVWKEPHSFPYEGTLGCMSLEKQVQGRALNVISARRRLLTCVL